MIVPLKQRNGSGHIGHLPLAKEPGAWIREGGWLDQARLFGQGVEDGVGVGQESEGGVKLLQLPILQHHHPSIERSLRQSISSGPPDLDKQPFLKVVSGQTN